MKNTNYIVQVTCASSSSGFPNTTIAGYYDKTVSSVKIGARYVVASENPAGFSWKVSGFLAEGQYNSNYKQIIKY